MSAATSAPETAFCIDSIYGLDVDVLVWDFSLTDGTRREGIAKLEWFLHRAARNQNCILLAFLYPRG